MSAFENFSQTFLGSLVLDDFNLGRSLPQYLRRPGGERMGDEADIVDNKVVNGLVQALGYSQSEAKYNRSGEGGRRPDFALSLPSAEFPSPCAVTESKNTATQNVGEHLPQFEGYLRARGAQRGILVDGKQPRSASSKQERVSQIVMDLGDGGGYLHASKNGVVLMPWHNLAGVENRSIGPAENDERQRKEDVSKGYDLALPAGVLNSARVSNHLRSAREHSLRIFPEDFKDVPVPYLEPNGQKSVAERITTLHKSGLRFSSLRRQGWRVNSSTNVVIAPALLADGMAALPLSRAKIRWRLHVHDKAADLTQLASGGRSLFRRRRLGGSGGSPRGSSRARRSGSRRRQGYASRLLPKRRLGRCGARGARGGREGKSGRV